MEFLQNILRFFFLEKIQFYANPKFQKLSPKLFLDIKEIVFPWYFSQAMRVQQWHFFT
jgi:hypothetical protein